MKDRPGLVIGLAVLAWAGLAAAQQSPAAAPSVSVPAADSLSLEQAVRLAVQTHPSVEQAQAAVEAAQAQIGVARSASYPNLSSTADYTRLDPVSYFDLGGGRMDLFPHNNYDVHLGAGTMLYDFGRTATSVRLAEAGLTAARQNVESARWSLAYFTVSTFNLILILRENIGLLDEQINTLNEHLRTSQKKLDTGSATRLDLLTTQVRVAAAQNGRIDAASALEKQEIVLRQLIGYPPDRPAPLRGGFDIAPVGLREDSLLSIALSGRPELRAAQDAESSAAVQAQLAGLGEKPTLGLGLASGFKNGFFPNLERWRLNLVASLSLEVPLFDGRRTEFQKQFARAGITAARARSADLRRRITAEVEQAMASARASLEKIRNAQVQVDRAREALATARTQYAAGTATNLDLLDAETSLSEARIVFLRAQYDYVNDRNNLDRATGRRIW